MPEILTYNTPGSIEKEKTKRPFYRGFFDWFDSKDKFTKIYLITFALIILATPFIVNNYLEIRQKAEQQEQAPNIKGVNAVPDEILLKFKPGTDEKVQTATFHRYNLDVKEELPNIGVKVIKVNSHARDKVIEALSHNPAVDFAEVNAIVKPQVIPNDQYTNDFYLGVPSAWHLPKIVAFNAWDQAKATGVLIAVCDTGFTAVPDLAPVLRTDLGYNSVDDSTNWSTIYPHGTLVAGAAAAATNNSIGVSGVAWGAQIIPVRVSNVSDGNSSDSALAKCITYSADHGARVINMSFIAPDSSTIDSAGQYAQSKGAVTTMAGGNSSSDPGWPNYPGFLAVSATDSNDKLAIFSSWGAHIDMTAPGVGIMTTNDSGGYGAASGTSFSAPVTAGVLGLIFGANPSLSAAQAQSILLNNTDDLGTAGWDPQFGWGRVNAYKAVSAALGAPADITPPTALITSPTSGSTVSGSITVSASATDNVGVTKVELYRDGVLFATDTTSPYSFYWKTTIVSNGSHTLLAKAYDPSGNVGTSSPVTVTVSNAPDTTPPTVSITSPTNGAIVSGTVNISALATDNVAVTAIDFFVDNALISEVANPGLSPSISGGARWNTTTYANGTHTLYAKAVDIAGNIGTSVTITVTVNNVTSPTLTPTPTPSPTLTPLSSPTPTPSPTPISTPSDTTLPTVSITNPANLATVGRRSTVNITASASDNAGVTKVEFSVNGVLTCTSTSSPYSCSWQVPGKPNANYTLTAKAYDARGNNAFTSITVKSSY